MTKPPIHTTETIAPILHSLALVQAQIQAIALHRPNGPNEIDRAMLAELAQVRSFVEGLIPPAQVDRYCACGCGKKLSKANRSGWAAECHTKDPRVKERLAANRRGKRKAVKSCQL